MFEIVNAKGHWIAMRQRSSSILLHLYGKCSEWSDDTLSGQTGIWLKCSESEELFRNSTMGAMIPRSGQDNVEKTHPELRSIGVEFQRS